MIDDTAYSADLVFMAMLVLIGEQGVDWQEYVTCPEYWQTWAWMNRN